MIVDDHAVVRSGLRLLLEAEEDIEVVGEAGTAREAILEARSVKPDLVLMDVAMPDGSGLDVVPTLLHEHEGVKVLVLSMQDDPRYVREAFAVGASGYVLKEAADTEVVAAIREVARGGRYVHPELGARLVAADADELRRAEEDPLSEREQEVLRLLALGHTNQEIAKQLFISVRTAETHRAHIMQKLRLATRAELVRYALGAGPARRVVTAGNHRSAVTAFADAGREPRLHARFMSRTLVVHASAHGSTREVAEAVASTLRERGLDVDVRPARDLPGLDGYDAVVLGAALYMGRLHADARRFLKRRHGELAVRRGRDLRDGAGNARAARPRVVAQAAPEEPRAPARRRAGGGRRVRRRGRPGAAALPVQPHAGERRP